MAHKDQIIEKLDEILTHKQRINKDTEEGYFNEISLPLVVFGDQLREQIQAETFEQILAIIKKLRADTNITDTELELIRLWIVGDAASYVNMENDFLGWLEELQRLFSAIEEFKNKELTLEKMLKLSGIVQDTIRVIADIVFFKQQQERVTNFNNSSKNLNSQNKLVLADILKQKLESGQM